MPLYSKFPMLVYHPGQPDKRVEDEEELAAALESGFDLIPTQMTEEGKIQAQIEFHQSEIKLLKDKLADMKKKRAA